MFFIQTLLLCLIAAATILAHPGHNIAEEIAERAAYFKRNPRSLSKCSSTLQARGLSSEYITRRHKLANELHAARGFAIVPSLDARDFAAYNFSHLYSESGVGVDSLTDTNLAKNSSCVLQPDVTAGPYLVTAEAERSNVTNGEEGVHLTLLVQIIDTATCKPAPGLYVDMWQANSTGVYSGVMVDGNGNSKDATNLKNTAFRGFQQTDSVGVVRFDTVFPGHYTGRANHIHILTHNPNSTYLLDVESSSGVNSYIYHASHVGQLFFDQGLITKVEAMEPYASNKQKLTLNSEDGWLAQEAASSDPYVNYQLLGATVSDGLLGWMMVGINTMEDVSVATPYLNN